jgi:integrase
MSEIFKRVGSDVWQAKIRHPGKGIVRISTGISDENLAKIWATNRQNKVWMAAALDLPEPHAVTEAMTRWLEDSQKSSIKDDEYKISRLREFVDGKMLDDITYDSWSDILKSIRVKYGVSDTTLNRYTALMRAIMNAAAGKWRWIHRTQLPEWPHFQEPEGRDRVLTVEELRKLYDAVPIGMRSPFLVALSTGLRAANVFQMEWQWVDLAKRLVTIPRAKSKNRRPIVIPLNQTAYGAIMVQIGRNERYVFPHANGTKPMNFYRRAWKAALKATGIEDFRWHDMRHCFATILRESGVNGDDLVDLGGWLTRDMAFRYGKANMGVLATQSALLDDALLTHF